MNKDNTFTFLVDFITTNVVESLMNNKHITFVEAMSSFHNSETFEKLMNPDTGLYIESPAFIYNLFNDELSLGTIQGLSE
jgi:hypothetical protein